MGFASLLALLACERDQPSEGSGSTATTPPAIDDAGAASSAAASSGPASGDAAAICEKAADRYVGCMEQLLGEEAGALARGKRAEGIPVCARDPMTVSMYRKCLPETDCEKFQKCMMDFAKTTEPERPTGR